MLHLPDERFGSLTLLEEATSLPRKDRPQYSERRWLCRCDCGNEKIIRQSNLVNSTTKSCGCLANQTAKNRFRTHGKTGTYLHKIWNSIKRRCFNKNQDAYKHYGGRGITIYFKWLNDFNAFESWIIENIGHRPTPKHSLDRIKNNEDYKPNNLRWSTQKEQTNNQRRNALMTFRNRTHTLTQWSEKTGIPIGTIFKRRKLNWSVEEILTTPVKRFRNRPTITPDLSWLT